MCKITFSHEYLFQATFYTLAPILPVFDTLAPILPVFDTLPSRIRYFLTFLPLSTRNPENYYLTLATSTGLGGLMGYRFINSGKFMPAGLIALLSIGMIARFSIRALTSSTSLTHVKE